MFDYEELFLEGYIDALEEIGYFEEALNLKEKLKHPAKTGKKMAKGFHKDSMETSEIVGDTVSRIKPVGKIRDKIADSKWTDKRIDRSVEKRFGNSKTEEQKERMANKLKNMQSTRKKVANQVTGAAPTAALLAGAYTSANKAFGPVANCLPVGTATMIGAQKGAKAFKKILKEDYEKLFLEGYYDALEEINLFN